MEAEVVNIHDELVKSCLQGDQDAYYRLYALYSRSMYNVGYRIVQDQEEAEDVLQEAFISAFRNLSAYRGDSTFGAWLKRIVINKAINALKQKRNVPLEGKQVESMEDRVWELDELAGYPFTVEKVKKAMALLPDGYRTVFSLYLLEGYDHQEIADILGITESTSKSQFNRSKKKLKEILEGGQI